MSDSRKLVPKEYVPETLPEIRARQAQGIVLPDDPPVTSEESPTRTVRMRQVDGTFMDTTVARDHTPGLSPLDSAVRKMRSAAYAYNEGDYTATAIMAREALLEVQAALRDKTFMDVNVEVVEIERADEQ